LPRSDAGLGDRQRALAQFLKTASGAESVEISRVELLAGGAIQENWGIDASFEGGALSGTQRLVLRTDAATGVRESLGRVEEYHVLRAVFAAGVTVPEPLFACADKDVIGRPFFVMRRAAGSAAGRPITLDPGLETARPAIAAQLGRELARLQTICPPRGDLAFLAPDDGPLPRIAAFRAYLDAHPNPRPVLEWALRWTETHLPEPLPPVLCHRDFRTGNYLLAGGSAGARITAILDWEFAGWGDPDEDIGWLCCKGWRFGRLDREAGGVAGREPFHRGYEAESGRRPDPERVRFWEIFANIRWAIIALQQSDRFLVRGSRSLSTAITGRRATECELELLMLLDGDGARPASRSSPAGGGGSATSRSLGDLPTSRDLLTLARETLLDELAPLLPPERRRDAHLVATVMAIASRERDGEGWQGEISGLLGEFYGEEVPGSGLGAGLLLRLAADLRNGAFETSPSRAAAARAILWQLTMCKLREGNPHFLAANGFKTS
jgi:aminoglycoside phosphotransferase (APT) family kinase protein